MGAYAMFDQSEIEEEKGGGRGLLIRGYLTGKRWKRMTDPWSFLFDVLADLERSTNFKASNWAIMLKHCRILSPESLPSSEKEVTHSIWPMA
jgi:hypothetical protein